MSWRYYNFACPCGHVYEDMVNGLEHRPDPCPKCAGTEAVRTLTAAKSFNVIVPDYPGAKYHKAGFGHDLRRPAEKAGRQISMSGIQPPRRAAK